MKNEMKENLKKKVCPYFTYPTYNDNFEEPNKLQPINNIGD